MTAPIPPPMAMPPTIIAQVSGSCGRATASVVMTAMAMPAMPRQLPWREVSGEDSPRSARMNSTPATR